MEGIEGCMEILKVKADMAIEKHLLHRETSRETLQDTQEIYTVIT